MKCTSCGYVSFDDFEICKKCGADVRSAEGNETVSAPAGDVDTGIREGAWRLQEDQPEEETVKEEEAAIKEEQDEMTLRLNDEDTSVDNDAAGETPAVKSTDEIFEGILDQWAQETKKEKAVYNVPTEAADEKKGEEFSFEESIEEELPSEAEAAEDEEEEAQEDFSFEEFHIDLDEVITAGVTDEAAGSGTPDHVEQEFSAEMLPLEDIQGFPPQLPDEARAGFARRGGAFMLDSAIIFFIIVLFAVGGGVGLALKGASPYWLVSHFWLGDVLLPFFILSVLVSGAYYVYYQWARGQTPGKSLFSLKVTDEEGGDLPVGIAVLRWIAYTVSALPLGLGFIWAIFDRQGLTWHDRLTRTLVVRTGAESS